MERGEDFSAIRASGLSGELRVGYQRAMELGVWDVTVHYVRRRIAGFTIEAQIVSEHAYWATQTPQDLMLRVGSIVEWRWPSVTVHRENVKRVRIDVTERPTVSQRGIA